MGYMMALLLVNAASTPAPLPQSTSAPLVFDGVTVVDVTQGKLLPAQRVALVGDRIHAVGRANAVKIPKGAQVIDARGKYLIPGLWDMHVHTSDYASYQLLLANGVTGIRDAWSTKPLDTLRQWRREILAGTRVGPPRQLLSGAAIDERKSCTPKSLTHHTCITTGDSAAARRLVDTLKAAGADIIKPYDLSKEMYFVVAAEARRLGLRLGGHSAKVPAGEASDSGADIIDHSIDNKELSGACFYHEATLERCQPLATRFAQNGTWWVSTWIYPPRVAGRDPSRAIYARFDAFIRDFWADSTRGNTLHDYLQRDSIGPVKSRALRAGSLVDSLGYMYIMRRAGLPVLAGTDYGLDARPPVGFALHAELATYVAEGMTPLEALQTATLNPAKFLQGTDSLGTVAKGKLADLVLLDADPLADITNTTAIRAVVANGRYFDRAALDALLTEVQAKGKKP